jgi:hypothetical protein
MKLTLIALGAVLFLAQGCAFVGCDRVFPKLDWYWSKDAKRCRGDIVQQPSTVNTNQIHAAVGVNGYMTQ